jgi:hypothetical protein
MPRKKPARHASSVAARKHLELGLAVPQVMTHRLTRMALAGPRLSDRDRREFTGMVLEKPAAFAQGWFAAWMQIVKQQMAFAASLWTTMFAVGNAAMAPVHRKAVGNARRLARTPLLPGARRR